MFYGPITLIFFLAFWVLLAVLVALIQIGILQYVFESMGINRRYMLGLLLMSLLGSYINIPIAHLPGRHERMGEIVEFFGVQYVVPVVNDVPGTMLAVNIGGAVIPFLLSIYLVVKHDLYGKSLLAVGIVSLLVHLMARPVQGVGIAVPVLIPPLITALVALSLSNSNPAPWAYVAGSMGTLIGADLMNLGKVQGLGAPVASIGGAGKFDGIFLTGIVAVLLTTLVHSNRRWSRHW
ncbi:MAG TPA: DUF1614 domain-containing protein [Patescibacteria group bacterium]|nr:DUF1614 domain-containing protein [Patescibacteria group bacterium]